MTVLDHTCDSDAAIDSEGSAELRKTLRDLSKGCLIWLYVPNTTQTADETYPICQTYVDVVIGGCLEWGGEKFAKELIMSTSGWSDCFLNDAPLSRRPWLHRKQYRAIDKVLSDHEELTFFSKRKHPEEFAAQCNDALRGMWNLPKRNKLFVGREEQLHLLHRNMSRGKGGTEPGIVTLEAVGMGGVGKTQLAIEYCYRHYQEMFYGLVVWVNAGRMPCPLPFKCSLPSLALAHCPHSL
jgi:hypothetical protein